MTHPFPADNFYSAIVKNATATPNKTIIFEEDLKISNQQLIDYVDKVAGYLASIGIVPGNKVALVMSNSWQFVVNFFAISKLGAVVVPVNNFLKEDEIAYILNDAQAKVLFCSAKFAKETHDLLIKTNICKIIWVDGVPIENDKNISHEKILAAPTLPVATFAAKLEDLAVIVYTSGTTGKPKGAM